MAAVEGEALDEREPREELSWSVTSGLLDARPYLETSCACSCGAAAAAAVAGAATAAAAGTRPCDKDSS